MIKVQNFATRPYRILNTGESTDLQAFIDYLEVDTLKKLFGIELYNAFVAGLAGDPVEEKWTKLKDGGLYTFREKQFEYRGLEDLLVPCIFSFWVRENRDKFMSTGTVITNAKETDHVSPAWRVVDAYNTFARKAGGPHDQCGTLYGFLINSEFEYGNLVFQKPGFLNEFGL